MVKLGAPKRPEYYDRNASVIGRDYCAEVPAHSWTERWSYTVPSGKKFHHGILCHAVGGAIAVSGQKALISTRVSLDGGTTWIVCASTEHYETGRPEKNFTCTANFFLFAGHKLDGITYHNDTVNHWCCVRSLGLEFDE